jgi:hypothetical protein
MSFSAWVYLLALKTKEGFYMFLFREELWHLSDFFDLFSLWGLNR